MHETLEVRLPADVAKKLALDHLGAILPSGTVRRIRLPINDPAWEAVRDGETAARKEGKALIAYSHISRSYTAGELASALLVQATPTCMFEPAGEECGTTYDYSAACRFCGAGRVQSSTLNLDLTKAPRRCDFAFTIARDEWIVSERLAAIIRTLGFSGVELLPVDSTNRKGRTQPGWRQLAFSSNSVEVDGITKFGLNPFVTEIDGRCPLGHVAGHALLSEVTIDGSSWDGSDFARTRQLIGVRRGLLVPYPMMLISQRSYQALRENAISGLTYEVAHLV